MVPSRNILHLMELAFHKEITLQSLQSAKEIGCYIYTLLLLLSSPVYLTCVVHVYVQYYLCLVVQVYYRSRYHIYHQVLPSYMFSCAWSIFSFCYLYILCLQCSKSLVQWCLYNDFFAAMPNSLQLHKCSTIFHFYICTFIIQCI